MTTPAGANDDDEMELINAEFESMVAGLSLDESSPRTYLDELDEIEKEEAESINSGRAMYSEIADEKISFRQKMTNVFATVKRWWHGGNRDDGEDGARV
jgi:hypothetical protein